MFPMFLFVKEGNFFCCAMYRVSKTGSLINGAYHKNYYLDFDSYNFQFDSYFAAILRLELKSFFPICAEFSKPSLT